MKKSALKNSVKYLISVVTLIAVVFTFAACNKGGEGQDTPTEAPNANSDVVSYYDYDLDYLTLGEYKGIKVSKDITVSDAEKRKAYYDDLTAVEDLNEYDKDGKLLNEADIYTRLKDMYIKDTKLVENGDMVNIDYTGFLNGEKFEGGEGKDYDLIIGSNVFIPGFETAVVGHIAGTEFNIDVKFPADYHSKDLAGKDAVFTVKVNHIYPALSEETVSLLAEAYKLAAKKSQGDNFKEEEYVAEFATVDEYNKKTVSSIKETKEADFEESLNGDLLYKVYQDSNFASYPENLVAELKENIKTNASYYGVDEDTFLMYFYGISTEEDKQEFINYQVGADCIIAAIIQAENITISEKEFEDGCKKYATSYGYESVDALLKDVDRIDVENMLLGDKALELIVDSAEIIVVE